MISASKGDIACARESSPRARRPAPAAIARRASVMAASYSRASAPVAFCSIALATASRSSAGVKGLASASVTRRRMSSCISRRLRSAPVTMTGTVGYFLRSQRTSSSAFCAPASSSMITTSSCPASSRARTSSIDAPVSDEKPSAVSTRSIMVRPEASGSMIAILRLTSPPCPLRRQASLPRERRLWERAA